jgi:hypothetical protein
LRACSERSVAISIRSKQNLFDKKPSGLPYDLWWSVSQGGSRPFDLGVARHDTEQR